MSVASGQSNEASSGILETLKFVDLVLWEVVHEGVAEI